MGPIAIAVICATVFGVISSIAAFIHSMLTSRDKRLNDIAQQKALTQEIEGLEKLRSEMLNFKRYNVYYQVLGENKDAVQYLDQKIEEILKKKSDLIEHYAQVIVKESSAIVAGTFSLARKEGCDKLKEEVTSQLKAYDKEIEQLQKRRANLWDSHKELQDSILNQEKKHNEHMDSVYQQHSALVEKLFLRHMRVNENLTKLFIESSTNVFNALIKTPIEFLTNFFHASKGISPSTAQDETLRRQRIAALETSINAPKELEYHSLKQKEELESDPASAGYSRQLSFTG